MSQKQCICIALTNQLLLFRKVMGGITVRITRIRCVCVCTCTHACTEWKLFKV